VKFMLSIYGVESDWTALSQEAWAEIFPKIAAFNAKVSDLGGSIIVNEGLDWTKNAKSVRQGKVTDGPFLDTKESVGTYYLIEARDYDHAAEIATQYPVNVGGVEVRAIYLGEES
jgi:hypothetical protein